MRNIYESERRNREMLALLYEVSLDMSSTLEVDEVFHRIAAAVKSTVNYHIFSIFQLDERTGVLQLKIVIRSNERGVPEDLTVPLGSGLVGTAALMNVPVRVGDVLRIRATSTSIRKRVRSLPCRSTHKGQVIGVVDLESTELDYFTEYHERLLTTLASRIATALVNAQLYATGLGQRAPHGPRNEDRPRNPAAADARRSSRHRRRWIIAVTFKPVAHLGGDLYDFIHFDDGRLAIVAGRRCRKGRARGSVRSALQRHHPNACHTQISAGTDARTRQQDALLRRPIESQYCALTYAIYDPQTRKITLANSGLPYPLLVRDGLAEVPRAGRNSSRAVSRFDIPGTGTCHWSPAMCWSSTPTDWSKPATRATRISG